MNIPPIDLGRLDRLSLCRQSLQRYYESLFQEEGVLLRVAAIAALLELGAVREEWWPAVVDAAEYGAIKERAFKFFIKRHEYALVDAVLQKDNGCYTEIVEQRLLGERNLDFQRLVGTERDLFLATGGIEHLHAARAAAEHVGGWRESLPFALEALLALPSHQDGPFMLLAVLQDANQFELIETVCRKFQIAGVYPAETSVFSAVALAGMGRHKEALKQVERVQANKLANRLAVKALRVRAEAYEATGDAAQAFSAFTRQNGLDRRADLDAARFIAAVARRASYNYDPVPPNPNSAEALMMLGFPRSGTTLLENVLAAHPDIETFEEISALDSARQFIERRVRDGRVAADDIKTAQGRYYLELDRHSRKPEARVRIDKMPLLSAEAVFLEALFPGRRYIFSVRHPFDVVLSCFKQMFSPSDAMENFRTLEQSVHLYDFAMRQWFSRFTLDDQRVHYVKYDDLVERFTETVGGTISFLGLSWSDSVQEFAGRAQGRASRTPSYQKVRSGLTLGVQSTWRNYRSQFGPAEYKVLGRWAETFGYRT